MFKEAKQTWKAVENVGMKLFEWLLDALRLYKYGFMV